LFVDVVARVVEVLAGPSGFGVVGAVAEEAGDFGLVEMQGRGDLVDEDGLMLFDGRGLVVKVVALRMGSWTCARVQGRRRFFFPV